MATHILAFEGDSHVEWFEGNFADYEEDKKHRLGDASVEPHRIKFKRSNGGEHAVNTASLAAGKSVMLAPTPEVTTHGRRQHRPR